VLEARPITVNLNKHSRVPTVNLCNSAPNVTFMLDTGSRPNIIKENLPKGKVVNYTNVLKLNGMNEYPIYPWRNHVTPFRKGSNFSYRVK